MSGTDITTLVMFIVSASTMIFTGIIEKITSLFN
jgi:hypothetical protein